MNFFLEFNIIGNYQSKLFRVYMENTSLIETETFSPKWWDSFLHKTDNLRKTAVFKNCMTKKDTLLLRKQVLQIIQTLSKLRTNRFGYRVFEEGKQFEKDRLHEFYDQPPLDSEDLATWSKRIFGDKNFGIIINCGEKFHVELSKNIALKTEPYLEKIGFPREGVNFSIFIGNYSKTPIGIHRDPHGEDVMHFHLGPNKKTMYTWSEETYNNLVEEKKISKDDLEQLLPHSVEFSFEEGDMYFMPEGEYHVGKQEGLSIAITFWRYNHPKDTLTRKLLLESIFQEYFDVDGDLSLSADRNPLNSLEGLNETLLRFKIPDDYNRMNLKEFIGEMYKDLRYSIHSNAGYKEAPFVSKEIVPFDENDIVQIEQPFEILYKESINHEKLDVFVRGNKFTLGNFKCIKLFLDEINKGEKITVSDLLKILNDDLDEEIGIYILELIHQNHGIVKI